MSELDVIQNARELGLLCPRDIKILDTDGEERKILLRELEDDVKQGLAFMANCI